MASAESRIIETKLFSSRATEKKTLPEAITDGGTTFHGALALLYAPRQCFLAKVNSNSRFEDSKGEIDVEKEAVFEARVFNAIAELRWLNRENGIGKAIVLCEDEAKKFLDVEPQAVDKIYARIDTPQTYLLWGESVGESINGWTKFAEARIGSFPVPIAGVTANKKQRAQFTAIEYLGEYEDGNVVVAEERLTGMVIVPAEEKKNG
jgi:CRISPR-associated protein (TIGR03984 family)